MNGSRKYSPSLLAIAYAIPIIEMINIRMLPINRSKFRSCNVKIWKVSARLIPVLKIYTFLDFQFEFLRYRSTEDPFFFGHHNRNLQL